MLLLSLVGEQPIPILLPIRYLKPDENIFVYTGKTEEVATRLRRLISGSESLAQDIPSDPYSFESNLHKMQKALVGKTDIVFNLTGGTKMMALAAYALASQSRQPFLYLESEQKRSLLYIYEFQDNIPQLHEKIEIPSLITIPEYLNAHLPGFKEEGFSKDESGQLNEGGLFEQAVFHALSSRADEVMAGIRPEGVARQIEIDLVIRCGNQVGIAEVKLGSGEGSKRGLDQLKMAGEPTYLGTYTAQFLIIAAPQLAPKLSTLAARRKIKVIPLPEYVQGKPLTLQATDRLANDIHNILCP